MLILIIVVALVIVFAYSSYLWFYRKKELHAWITSLLTTLISVLLGVVTAVALLGYQDSRTTEIRRVQLLGMVSIELVNNTNYLRNETFSLQVSNKKWNFRSSYLSHQAIDSAAMSGIFSDQQAKDLFTLGDNIRFYNALIDAIDRLYTINPINYRVAMADHLYKNQQGAYAAMASNLTACRLSLGIK